jgi:hypothetical protein
VAGRDGVGGLAGQQLLQLRPAVQVRQAARPGAPHGITVTNRHRRVARSLQRGLAAIPWVRLLGSGLGTDTLPIATFTVGGIPSALARPGSPQRTR